MLTKHDNISQMSINLDNSSAAEHSVSSARGRGGVIYAIYNFTVYLVWTTFSGYY